MSTYSTHAEICARFYDLIVDGEKVGAFVLEKSRAKAGERALFVGGFFEVARYLKEKGLDLEIVDYSDDMVKVGRTKVPGVVVSKADLRALPSEEKFDCVFVIGRVLTHMISEEDLASALTSCRRALKRGGRLFFDNYENSRIQETSYFNGVLGCSDADTKIERVSRTAKISDVPFVVRWDARYSGEFRSTEFSFSDSMLHRAFSRSEIAALLPKFKFSFLEQGDNFDETSFFTLARAV